MTCTVASAVNRDKQGFYMQRFGQYSVSKAEASHMTALTNPDSQVNDTDSSEPLCSEAFTILFSESRL